MGEKCSAVGLHNFEHHRQSSRSHIQLTSDSRMKLERNTAHREVTSSSITRAQNDRRDGFIFLLQNRTISNYALLLFLFPPAHLLMTHDSSKRTGNHPLTQTLSSSGMLMSSPACSLKAWGLSATYFAQLRIRRIASMLVSGKAALQANSERHFTAS